MTNHVFVVSPFVDPFNPTQASPAYASHPLVQRHIDTVFDFLMAANALTGTENIHLLGGHLAHRKTIRKALEYDIPYDYGVKQGDNVFMFVSSDGYIAHENMEELDFYDEDEGPWKWRQYIVDEAVVPPFTGVPITPANIRSIRSTTYTYVRNKFDSTGRSRTLYKGNKRESRYGVEVVNLTKGSEIYNTILGNNPVKQIPRYLTIYNQNGESTGWSFVTSEFMLRERYFEVIASDLTSDNPCALFFREDKDNTGKFTSYLPPKKTNMPASSMFATYSKKGLLDGEYNVFSNDDLAEVLYEFPANFFMVNAFNHAGGMGTGLYYQNMDNSTYIMNMSSIDGNVHYWGSNGCIGVDAFEHALLSKKETFDDVLSFINSEMSVTNNIRGYYQSVSIFDARRGDLYGVPYKDVNWGD